MNYFLKKFLFSLPPETAHGVALNGLSILHFLKMSHLLAYPFHHPRQVMGLTFENPIGLAAGFDKNGDYIDALFALGFGFIEIGTITPKPQIGNPKPRIFRFPRERALINRLGFNNKGIEYVAKKLSQRKPQGILGINIGKNKETPLQRAIDDYLLGFNALWPYASYITINISSPNTPNLRMLQQKEWLLDLLIALKKAQEKVQHQHEKYVPLVIKISPDLTMNEINDIAEILLQQQIDGVIATNTSVQHEGVMTNQMGGLSGQPLQKQSTKVLRELHLLLKDKIPIIGCGGVMDATSAHDKILAGASLLQVYTGFIYEGVEIIKKIRDVYL